MSNIYSPSSLKDQAEYAAKRVLKQNTSVGDSYSGATAVVLGTGWKETLEFVTIEIEVPLGILPRFDGLSKIEGHERTLILGRLKAPGEPRVIALSGRVHMNEGTFNPNATLMVRRQIELLFALGAKNLVLTSAVGATVPDLQAGSVAVLSGFTSFGNEVMPLCPGEFVQPESAFDNRLQEIASHYPDSQPGVELSVCGDQNYCFYRGAHFESREDKLEMAKRGAHVVGMSMKPEACVAALYTVPTLGLCLVTNGLNDKPDHEQHLKVAAQCRPALNWYLTRIISEIISTQAE